jgi:transposase
MAGRFEGLSDLEWKLFEDICPETPKKRARGMPPVPFRYVLNSLLYMLITGCRWCDPRQYIIHNSAKWQLDRNNSQNSQKLL